MIFCSPLPIHCDLPSSPRIQLEHETGLASVIDGPGEAEHNAVTSDLEDEGSYEHEEQMSEADEEEDKEPWNISHFTPPTLAEARAALRDIEMMLKPPRKTGRRYKDPRLTRFLQTRLEFM